MTVLSDIKDSLEIDLETTAFDKELLAFINGFTLELEQIGCLLEPFVEVTAQTDWGEVVVDGFSASAKQWVFLKTKLLWDPPSNSFTVAPVEKQIEALYWRMNSKREMELENDVQL